MVRQSNRSGKKSLRRHPTLPKREELVLAHVPLVKHVLNKVATRLPPCVDREDLLESGMVGLLNAADRFDPHRNVQFRTYALPRIRGAMLDSLRSEDWLPRSLRDKLGRLQRARAALEQEKSGPPTLKELSTRLQMSRKKLDKLNRVSANCSIYSIEDVPRVLLNDEGTRPLPRHDRQTHPDERSVFAEEKGRLAEAVRRLPERERLVITLYYFEELALGSIADVLHVTDSRVCQIHRGALKRLHRLMEKPEPELAAATT